MSHALHERQIPRPCCVVFRVICFSIITAPEHINDTQDSCEAQHGGYERILVTISTVCAWCGSRMQGVDMYHRWLSQVTVRNILLLSAFPPFSRPHPLRHFNCTGTKYFICDRRTGPKLTERVFHVRIVAIAPKVHNQPVFPAKFGILERLDYSFSTTACMNIICRRILLRIWVSINLQIQKFYFWPWCWDNH